jgi:hypothetical protein
MCCREPVHTTFFADGFMPRLQETVAEFLIGRNSAIFGPGKFAEISLRAPYCIFFFEGLTLGS